MSNNKKYKGISVRHAAESIYKVCKEENLDYADKINTIKTMIDQIVKNETNKTTCENMLKIFNDN